MVGPSRPDPEKLGESPSSEEVLDHAIEETFPASDPISGGHAFNRLDTRFARESRQEAYRFLARHLKPPNPPK